MNLNNCFRFLLSFVTSFAVTASLSALHASENEYYPDNFQIVSIKPYQYQYKNGLYFELADVSAGNNGVYTSDKNSDYDINWHKFLGWSTAGMTIVTLASGHIIPHNGHCQLAGITTELAVAACITGYYKYGSIISFSNGDWKYNIHAIAGTAATIGFIATLALAGENGSETHMHIGAASGVAFSLTIGILYF